MTNTNVTTPKGVLVYPHLNKADTKFDTHGVWRANLRLTAEDAQSLKQTIDDAIEANADESPIVRSGHFFSVGKHKSQSVFSEFQRQTTSKA